MKTTLIHESYDKETGISIVGLGSKHGIFWGESNLLEEDKEFASQLRGLTYAEMKAYIKVMKAEYREQKTQLKGMENLYKAMKNYKNTDVVTMHYIAKQVELQKTKIMNLKQEIKDLERGFVDHIAKNDFLVRKFAKFRKTQE